MRRETKHNISKLITLVAVTLITASCGVSSGRKSTLSSGAKTGTHTGSSLNSSPFNMGVSDTGGSNYSSQEPQRPTSGPLVQPSAQLNGLTPWDYMNQVVPMPPSQVVEPRAVVTPGKYRFVIGPKTGIASNHIYTLTLPATVNFIGNEAGCAPSPQGLFAAQTVLCLQFTTPAPYTPLQIRLSVNGPQINATQSLWVLVLPPPQRPADQIRVVQSAGAMQPLPPVVINHKVYVNESNSRSVFSVMPSEFLVTVQGPGSGFSVNSMSVEPATSGTATRLNNTDWRISISKGGAVKLTARGSDSYGAFDVSSNLAVPRQINAVWTRNNSSRPQAASSEVSGLVCSNSGPVTAVVNVIPEQTSAFPVTIPAYRSDVPSNTFVPVFDFGYNLMDAKATVTLDGNVPVGAVTCRAITYSCANMSNSACITTLRQDFILGRDRF